MVEHNARVPAKAAWPEPTTVAVASEDQEARVVERLDEDTFGGAGEHPALTVAPELRRGFPQQRLRLATDDVFGTTTASRPAHQPTGDRREI